MGGKVGKIATCIGFFCLGFCFVLLSCSVSSDLVSLVLLFGLLLSPHNLISILALNIVPCWFVFRPALFILYCAAALVLLIKVLRDVVFCLTPASKSFTCLLTEMGVWAYFLWISRGTIIPNNVPAHSV